MWNELIGQLGKAIEESFDDPDEILDDPKLSSSTALPNDNVSSELPWEEVNPIEKDEDLSARESNSAANAVDNVTTTEVAAEPNEGDNAVDRTKEKLKRKLELHVKTESTNEATVSMFSTVKEGNAYKMESSVSAAPQESAAVLSHSQEEALLKFQQQLVNEMNESDRLREENSRMKLELEKTRATMTEKLTQDNHLAFLNGRLEEEMEKNRILCEDLETKKQENIQLQDELQELSEELESLKHDLQQCKEAESTAQQRIDELEILSERKSSQLGSLQSKLNEIKDENLELLSQLEMIKENTTAVDAEMHHKITEENIRLTAEVERLSSELQTAIVEYESRLQQMDTEVFEASSRANDAEIKLEEMERNSVYSLQSVRTDVESMQGLLAQTASMRAALESQCDELRKENIRLKSQKKVADLKLDDLEAAQQAELKEIISRNATLNLRISKLEEEKADYFVKISALEKEVKELRKMEWSSAMLPSAKLKEDEKPEISVGDAPKISVKSTAVPYWPNTMYPVTTVSSGSRSNPRLENEVLRQSLVIKELREELQALQAICEENEALKLKNTVLMQMYGELNERQAGANSSESAQELNSLRADYSTLQKKFNVLSELYGVAEERLKTFESAAPHDKS